ncbi:MAG: preprotein translocase subunit YajC [Planctomycetes bacterium]|nr:preprotein translocase subunit YajC [Planctomycetota bacterium]
MTHWLESWISAWAPGAVLLAQEGAEKAANGPAKPPIPFYVPLAGVAVLFYFMLIRPERRKRAEQDKLLENLALNDHIVTIGGVYGRVVSLDKESIVIRLEDDARARILRSAVARVISENRDEAK